MREIDTIVVPDFSFSAIKIRAQRRPRKNRMRRMITIAGLAVLVPALAAAAAVRFFQPQVYQSGDTLHIYSNRLITYARPSAATLTSVVKSMPYRIILPRNLPVRAKLGLIAVADAQLITLSYGCPQKTHVGFVIGPRNLQSLYHPPLDPHRHVVMTPRIGSPWHSFLAGEQIVRFSNDCLTKREMGRIQAAMIAAGKAVK